MISDEEKERVRQATDVLALVGETVELRRKGSSYWGCCPFHHEKSPSFHVDPSTGLWKCFGCGKGGDIFKYVMEREHLEFPDSIRYLAEKANIELQEEVGSYQKGPRKKRIYDCCGEAEKFYNMMLCRGRAEGCAEGRSYLSGRGFGLSVCKDWMLGYAPGSGSLVNHLHSKGFNNQEIIKANLAMESTYGGLRDRFFNRVMFPIHDESGRCVGFGGRVLDDSKPKYLNTSETQVFHKSKNMFAADRAREGIVAKNLAIVVEGYTDVITLHEAGYTNVVATLGTALTEEHVKLLSRFAETFIFMFDGDNAGKMAAERAIKYVDKTSSDLRCVVLPNNLDPADFINTQGAEALQKHLDASRPLIDFVFDNRLKGVDLTVPGKKVQAFKDMCSLLSVFKNSVLLDTYATKLSDIMGLDLNTAKQGILNATSPFEDAPTTSYASGKTTTYAPEYDPYADVDAYYQDDRGYEDTGVVDSYMVATPQALEINAVLTKEDMQQLEAERELLSLLVQKPELLSSYRDSLLAIEWVEPHDRQICEAMLACDESATPQQIASAAINAVDGAAQVLASGKMDILSSMSTADKAIFLLTNIELFMSKRKIRQNKGVIARGVTQQQQIELLNETTQLKVRVKELNYYLATMANKTING